MDALIGTTIIVDLLRNHSPLFVWMNANQSLQLAITPIVWLELIAGARDRKTQDQIEQVLSPYQMEYLIDTDLDWVMRQFRQYKLSHGIGILDCLIAAPAYRLQIPLYTKNLKHFEPLLGSLAQKPY